MAKWIAFPHDTAEYTYDAAALKKNWARLGNGLPNGPVLDLKLTGDGNTIYAATFGRGIYQIPAP